MCVKVRTGIAISDYEESSGDCKSARSKMGPSGLWNYSTNDAFSGLWYKL